MEKFFKLKENGTKVSTELIAGLTTFCAMSYIIFVNPQILSQTGMPGQAVFLATIIAAVAGTLVMALFANVPYAQAPGMGLNAFFTYTVCFALGFTWQQALAMVFICGIVNIIITVTRFRKAIIKSIPESLQNAIGGGIGIFIAYIGIKNANLVQFTVDAPNIVSMNGAPFTATTPFPDGVFTMTSNGGAIPALVTFNTPAIILAVIAIVLTIVLLVRKVKGAILIGIVITTLLAIPMGITNPAAVSLSADGVAASFRELGSTFGAAFTEGMPTLFSDPSRILMVIMTIFAFSISDTFDTIGTFIGTGRQSGIFTAEDMRLMDTSSGFKSRMDKALFADATATSIGAVFGTSNTTTYVESAAGIGAGGRTGLTSVFTAIAFIACIFLAPVVGLVPAQATAPALIVVGIMMMSAFKDIKWAKLEEAIPAFFAGVFMALCYSISYGIAMGFLFYCIVKIVKGKAGELHPILVVSTILFVLNFIVLAVI